MISRIIKKTVDLSKIQKVDQLEGPLYQLENGGHTFEITCMMDGEAAAVSGTVSARFLRSDEETVYFTGTLTGNVASVTLPQSCYNANGRFGLVVFIAGNDITSAVYAVAGSVYRSTSDHIIDPTEEIPSLEDLIAKIDECEEATASAQQAASFVPTIIASTYSTSVMYAVGDYCTHEGAMLRCTAETDGEFDPADWETVKVGTEFQNVDGQIDDLKSELSISIEDEVNALTNKGRGRWTINGNTVSFVTYSSSSDYSYAMNPVEVEPGDVIHVIMKATNGEAVIFANYENEVYTLVSSETQTRNVNIDRYYTVGQGVNCVLLTKWGTQITYYCNFVKQKTDATLTLENVPADAKVVGDAISDLDIANVKAAISDDNDNYISSKGIVADLEKTKTTVNFLTVASDRIVNIADIYPFVSNYGMSATKGTIAYGASYTQLYAAYDGVTTPNKFFIDVSKYTGSIYIIQNKDNTSWVRYVFLDSEKNIIGGTATRILSSESTETVIQIPEGAVYANFDAQAKTNKITESKNTTKIYFIKEAGAEPEPEEPAQLVLNVPDYYELVVGDTFQLFYRGIVLAAHDTDYDIEITCSKGSAYSKFYEYTPTTTGDVSMTIDLYDTSHNHVDTASLTLKVKAKASSPGSMKTVLYVGDSLTSGGYAPGEFKRRVVGSGGEPVGDGLTNVQFIGSVSNNNVNYEGQGGRTFKKYIEAGTNDTMIITAANHGKTDADQKSIYKDSNSKEWELETIETGQIMIIRESSSGTLPSTGTLTWVSGGENHDSIVYTASEQAPQNPFWDTNQGKVNFATYATRMGTSSIDYVYVLLGWNWETNDDDVFTNNVTTFIDNVLASFPNCKVVLMGLQAPSRDGLGVSYKPNHQYAHYFDTLAYAFGRNEIYKGIADSEDYNGKVFYVNISGQFDSEHNMQTGTRKVNTRSSATETYGKNGIHPAQSGYYQIADAAYRDFMHRLQD